MRAIIFTDLDASLLHEETFSCLEIIDALNSLLSDGVLIIPNTSKTEVETRNVLKSLNLKTPFIIENGAKLKHLNSIRNGRPPRASQFELNSNVKEKFSDDLDYNYE